MISDISITPAGNYLVSVFRRDENGYGRWRELRCFWSQGDARAFAHQDVPRFSDKEITLFIRSYKPNKIYTRFAFKNYRAAAEPKFRIRRIGRIPEVK